MNIANFLRTAFFIEHLLWLFCFFSFQKVKENLGIIFLFNNGFRMKEIIYEFCYWENSKILLFIFCFTDFFI